MRDPTVHHTNGSVTTAGFLEIPLKFNRLFQRDSFDAISRADMDGSTPNIEPIAIAAYSRVHSGSDATKRRHPADLRRLFDRLVTDVGLSPVPVR